MTTEPLFREDAYLREATATVIAAGPDGIVFDRTVFYAASGGQPGDTGQIRRADGSTLAVADTVKGADGAILHRLADGAALPAIGETVTAAIDWDRRHRLMRMHTALHLLCALIPGAAVTGGAIGDGKGRLDFDLPEAPAKEALTAGLAALIAADHPVTTEWISEAALDANPGLVRTLSVKPPRGAGRVRLVRIGAGDPPVDLQPCGGTHVRSTGEIGRIAIAKVENKGRQNRRIALVLEG
ncbi:alanyl-tRNA editing protein [Elioraea sp. Yellowstone]|jgi:misacylated tRNA(Ala) deacylase|uniref:alanyl-tRNA editing protein n=1 Tax=Elioraea sp. Yellowstone TaxID=2592070 RepID=UPI001154BACF|nr:alanyl-tRNA editing protein [Elioraea sp. Yellowstone]TQF77884.1 alanyl-tRNA editing protein [Elioraea sp. Yellowstone]